jgi:hypothetical protein
MELIKVFDIINYGGRIYFIKPYIEDGKIKRKSVYSAIKKAGIYNNYNGCYSLGRLGRFDWYGTIFHRVNSEDKLNEDTIASGATATYPIRFFTEREEAKKALEEYEAQSTYRLSESIDRELKYLEAEKKKINDKIKELKEKRKECFSKLTTSFVKKS